jgi:ligand-binding sensor domain-containing protein/anti-sigma regulatory factor (Ser/Thr protein kinase)
MRSLKHGFALGFSLALVCAPAFGLESDRTLTQYVHRIWQAQQGLPQGAISQIFQTHDGYLWLATQAGLVRFDGVAFTPVEEVIPGAPSNLWTRNAIEDSQGALWITSNDTGVFRLAPGGSTQYTTAQGLPSDVAQCLVPDGEGVVWACTENGLARIESRGGGEQHISVFHTADGLASENVHAACKGAGSELWVGGNSPQLNVWNGRTFSSLALHGIPASASVRALLCSGDTVWAGTSDGLIRVRGSEQRLYTVQDGLADNFVFSLAPGSNGTLWIGTRSGFSRLREDALESFRPRDGLSQSTALSIYEDREGNLWVGTKRGLNQFVDGRGVPYTVSEGLPSNEAGPVLEDHQGVIWAGTLDAGLARFDGRQFSALNIHDGLPSNSVHALAEDADGSLWVGTRNGASRLRKGKVAETYTTAEGLPANFVRTLFLDRNGVLWAGTTAGLARFDGSQFVTVTDAPREPVVALAGTADGHVVLATESRVLVAQGNGFREIKQGGASLRGVNTFYLDSDGLLWMGLNGGGLRLLKGGDITAYTVREGLYDGEINGIAPDGQGRLWMACSRGIFAVLRADLLRLAAGEIKKVTSLPYGPTDAQRVIESQAGVEPAVWRMRDGRLWFATIRGLIALEPAFPPREGFPPPVMIENPVVNGQSEPPEQIGQLPPGQKNVEFIYTGLSYYLPARIRFKYILEGYDKDWTNAGTRREASYTNLPPGNFRFRVTACNFDGQCNETGAAIAFTLTPHFYQRAWFWPLSALLLGLCGWLAYHVHIRHLRGKYELIVAERSRIARELHDTLIQGFSGITMAMQALAVRLRSSDERNTLEEIIRDAATCLRETRQSVAGLRAVPGPESGLAVAIADAAREITETKDVRLKLKLDKSVRRLPAEVEYNVLRIASEAVSNSVKHSGAHNIEVALQSSSDAVRLTVKDDGQGFEKEQGPRSGHYGLIGMKERASHIGADLELITEPGNGTTVSVMVPAMANGSGEHRGEPAAEPKAERAAERAEAAK